MTSSATQTSQSGAGRVTVGVSAMGRNWSNCRPTAAPKRIETRIISA